MDSKGPDAFRTISEVAGDLDLPQHVLRFWETRFSQIKPMKRGGGRRYYRPDDVDLLRGIRHLLYEEGYTIKGVQRILKERGIRFVSDAVTEYGGAPASNGGPVPDNATLVAAQTRNKREAPGDATAGPAHGSSDQIPPTKPAARPSASPPQPSAETSATEALIESGVPKDILLDDPPAKRADQRSLIDKIRGVPEAEQDEIANPAKLSRDDIRRLQSTLFELLECKRILDRSRSG